MHSKVIWSFLSLVALATGGMITGCDSDAKIAKSGVGESCDTTSDCNDGLKCLEGACYKKGTGTGGGGNEAGEGNTGATTTGATGPKPPVLGGEGESCTKRADCMDGLGCFNERCTKDSGGEGGEGNVPGVKLGGQGETCTTAADCAGGLVCVPGGYPGYYPGQQVGLIGICSTPSTTLKPTGKSCGAECLEAADCCELPVQLHVAYAVGTPYGTGANSCTELEGLLKGVKCATTAVPSEQARCFAMEAYCDCADDTWSCDAGQCNYTGACTEAEEANVPGGCPTYTRSGTLLANTTCNEEGACAPAPSMADPCKKDVDCDGANTADTAEKCADGECTCFKETGGCFRRCDRTLDCASGFVCDDATSVCVTAPSCETNEQCSIANSELGGTWACVDDACQRTCKTDYDCGTTIVTSQASLVCAADHTCRPVGCSTDNDCNLVSGAYTLHMFCTEPAVGEAGPDAHSAITD